MVTNDFQQTSIVREVLTPTMFSALNIDDWSLHSLTVPEGKTYTIHMIQMNRDEAGEMSITVSDYLHNTIRVAYESSALELNYKFSPPLNLPEGYKIACNYEPMPPYPYIGFEARTLMLYAENLKAY